MFATPSGESADVAPAVCDEFLDLLCADEELLRAEFEEIVSAQWPTPPTVRAGPRARGRPGPSPRPARRHLSEPGPTSPPAAPFSQHRSRERSPPPVDPHHPS